MRVAERQVDHAGPAVVTLAAMGPYDTGRFADIPLDDAVAGLASRG
ncbi:hypothetical protein ACFS27_17950 [Promicromonospora vindobonensis]|uniref:Uncharacterized protein n=1 Tax=Promicromonospora vindobonensis TaxID=195748 RepID=A0ABW5VZ96_9MICO